MRQRHKPWADDFLKENDQFVIPNAKNYKGRWHELFNNDHPIHVEVGTGKGQFISQMAKQYPHINFIGIEMAKSIIVSAAQKVVESDAENVLLMNENANDLLEIFAENEVENLYLNFSDPWPKNRHEKRRLTFHTFLQKYERILVPGGEIILKTDNQGLMEYSIVSMTQYGMWLEEVNLDLHNSDAPTNVMTEYEEKFSANGARIYRLRATFKQ